jgi:hypothetical protein
MSNFNLNADSFLLDVAVALTHGLKRYKYKPGEAVFLARECALRMVVSDPETGRTYSVVIKEVRNSETDTQISKD